MGHPAIKKKGFRTRKGDVVRINVWRKEEGKNAGISLELAKNHIFFSGLTSLARIIVTLVLENPKIFLLLRLRR